MAENAMPGVMHMGRTYKSSSVIILQAFEILMNIFAVGTFSVHEFAIKNLLRVLVFKAGLWTNIQDRGA